MRLFVFSSNTKCLAQPSHSIRQSPDLPQRTLVSFSQNSLTIVPLPRMQRNLRLAQWETPALPLAESTL